jgi:hypothetical protein
MIKFHAKRIVADIKIGVQVKGNVFGTCTPMNQTNLQERLPVYPNIAKSKFY